MDDYFMSERCKENATGFVKGLTGLITGLDTLWMQRVDFGGVRSTILDILLPLYTLLQEILVTEMKFNRHGHMPAEYLNGNRAFVGVAIERFVLYYDGKGRLRVHCPTRTAAGPSQNMKHVIGSRLLALDEPGAAARRADEKLRQVLRLSADLDFYWTAHEHVESEYDPRWGRFVCLPHSCVLDELLVTRHTQPDEWMLLEDLARGGDDIVPYHATMAERVLRDRRRNSL